jgi:hypothetical protein
MTRTICAIGGGRGRTLRIHQINENTIRIMRIETSRESIESPHLLRCTFWVVQSNNFIDEQ